MAGYECSDDYQCLICRRKVNSLREESDSIKICKDCIIQGKLGEMMAKAILKDVDFKKLRNAEYRKKIFYETEKIMETTKMHFYKNLFHGTIDLVCCSSAEIEIEKSEPENKIQDSEGRLIGEVELLNYLDGWKSINEIKKHFNVSEVELSGILNRLFFKGYVLKRILTDDQMFMRTPSEKE
jgi:hypothetical protein